jgi:hypothetical protein
MSRFTKTAFALSLLVASSATAFAGEGTYAPVAVASPATGAAPDRGVAGSFVFSQAEGGSTEARPAVSASGPARGPALVAGGFNAGLNG